MEKRAVGSSRSFRNAPLHDAQHLQDVVAKEAVFNRQSLLPCKAFNATQKLSRLKLEILHQSPREINH